MPLIATKLVVRCLPWKMMESKSVTLLTSYHYCLRRGIFLSWYWELIALVYRNLLIAKSDFNLKLSINQLPTHYFSLTLSVFLLTSPLFLFRSCFILELKVSCALLSTHNGEGWEQKLIASLRAASGFPKVNDPLLGNNYCGMQTYHLFYCSR